MTASTKKTNPETGTFLRPLFFLRGPVQGGGDWQTAMAKLLFKHEASIDVTCQHSASTHLVAQFFTSNNQDEPLQVLWEKHYPRVPPCEIFKVGCAIYWLPLESETKPHPGPEPYAMDTRRELGKLTAYLEVVKSFPSLYRQFPTKFVIGGHRGFYGLSAILDELSGALGKEVPFYEDMETCVQHAIVAARQ